MNSMGEPRPSFSKYLIYIVELNEKLHLVPNSLVTIDLLIGGLPLCGWKFWEFDGFFSLDFQKEQVESSKIK